MSAPKLLLHRSIAIVALLSGSLLVATVVGCQDAPSGDQAFARQPANGDRNRTTQPTEEDSQQSPTDKGPTDKGPTDKGPTDKGPAKEPTVEQEPADPLEQLDLTAAAHPFPRRQPAPSLDGGLAWINSEGPLEMKDLKGKFVFLDFWTYCCINCIHILPELKKLEHAYPNNVVVIGVHSAKFDEEKDSQNIRDAVLRYDIEHPVVNDAEFAIFRRYGIGGWPGLRVIDPEGNLVAGHGGEIDFDDLDLFLKDHLPYYRKKGLLDEQPVHFALERTKRKPTPLKYPGKILADANSKRLFIADTGHHRVVITDLQGKLIDIIGDGQQGHADGEYAKARFNNPQGMALDGETLYLADTQNHLLRKIDLKEKRVTTIAGDGTKGGGMWPGFDFQNVERGPDGLPKFPERWVGPPLTTPLGSPWALHLRNDVLFIAMAGPHQIWSMKLDGSEIGPYAGNGIEDIADGRLLPKIPPRLMGLRSQPGYSSFAQPSGLAADDKWLYVADSEGSAIRAVPFDDTEEVFTVVGEHDIPQAQALFSFGDVDGKEDEVRLQHVLGVTRIDKKLYVTDTYNNKIKVIDIDKRTSTTLSGDGKQGSGDAPAQFDEPSGISHAGQVLYIADTNNSVIRTLDLANGNKVTTLKIDGLTPPQAAPVEAAAFPVDKVYDDAKYVVRPVDGKIKLVMELTLPQGIKINELGPAKYVVKKQQPGQGVVDSDAVGKTVRPEKRSQRYEIELPVTAETGSDHLTVSQTYFYCEVEGGLCKVGNVVWEVPIELSADAKSDVVSLIHHVK